LNLFDLIRVIVVSALPISELRGGIPLAIYLNYTPIQAYFISIIGNLLPIFPLLLFLEKILPLIERFKLLRDLFHFASKKAIEKRRLVDKYGYLGLFLFVAIPLPITGAWTASLISFLLRMNPYKAFLFIAMGVFTAGVIVLLGLSLIILFCDTIALVLI